MSLGGPLLALLGPTAVGKTSAAIRLAKALDGEIVSVDSRQIYRGMDIGTAKPTAEEQAEAAHHLIDVADPNERYSAARYQRQADRAVADIRARGKLPILAGGAGLYYRALIDGIFDGPSADPVARKRLEAEAEAHGSERLRERLLQIDPEAAQSIHANDRIRLIRALEVYEISGTTISELRKQWKREPPRYQPVAVGLRRGREALNRRINARVKRMLSDGLEAEVRALRRRYQRSDPAFNGYGYGELWDSLDGKLTFDKAVEIFKRNTRRYAKRQMTWFRADRRIQWIDLNEADGGDAAADGALRIWERRASESRFESR